MTFFGAAPFFNLEILGMLNATILSISRSIWGAIASPAPPSTRALNEYINRYIHNFDLI